MNDKLKKDIEISVESKLIEYSQFCGTEKAMSSRVMAGNIVDMVLRKINGEEVKVKKPWEFFAVKRESKLDTSCFPEIHFS